MFTDDLKYDTTELLYYNYDRNDLKQINGYERLRVQKHIKYFIQSMLSKQYHCTEISEYGIKITINEHIDTNFIHDKCCDHNKNKNNKIKINTFGKNQDICIFVGFQVDILEYLKSGNTYVILDFMSELVKVLRFLDHYAKRSDTYRSDITIFPDFYIESILIPV